MIGRNIAKDLMLQSCKVMMLVGMSLGKRGRVSSANLGKMERDDGI